MGITPVVMASLTEAEALDAMNRPGGPARLWEREADTRWHKLDHLLYLPVLGLTRPRDLYYYQGAGLKVLYGFTYKYLPLEHFLGRLTRLGVSQSLALNLATGYSQAWYPGDQPLDLFVDWHIKPHWTKQAAQSGHITMWGRVMPGTKQLIVNGPGGHLLGGWNEVIDAHLSRVLVELEVKLEAGLQRPIHCTICDSEGGGLPTGRRYAEAGRYYLSLLPQQNYRLSDFVIATAWQPVSGDPAREVVVAQWRDPLKAAEEVRDLVLLRRVGQADLSRVYAGRLPPALPTTEVPGLYRQRWAGQERVIRELVNGANLNANFGYTYQEVPNRTRQRQWDEAQAKVEVSEQRLAQHDTAIANLRQQLVKLRHSFSQDCQALTTTLLAQQAEFLTRHQAGQRLRRCQQRLAGSYRRLDALTARYRRRRQRLRHQLRQHRSHQTEVKAELLARQTARDDLDTASLCRERDLAKDQLMLNLQILLANLHDWTRSHYLAPLWRHLELPRAIELIYRKPGRVHWGEQEIEVILEPYRYPEHQRAMEETCRRFNAAQLLWRDGRRLRIRVAPAG